MKTIFKSIIISFTALLFIGCSVSVEEDPYFYETDNEYTDWTYHSSDGYSGGDTKFAGLTLAGEWSVVRTLNYSGLAPSFDLHSSVLFDDIRWYRYEFDSLYGSDLIYEFGYSVSRDGLTLMLNDYDSYTVESVTFNENYYGYCINAIENSTGDIYSFYKID